MEPEASVYLMEEKKQVSRHLMEEEKNGWTIVSSVQDNQKTDVVEELTDAKAKETEKSIGFPNRVGKEGFPADEEGPIDSPVKDYQEDRKEGERGYEEEEEEEEEEEKEEEEDKSKKDMEDGDSDHSYCGDGDDEQCEEDEVDVIDDFNRECLSPVDDARKDFTWGSCQKGPSLLDDERMLVHQQVHKHGGLLWRVSLVATLGFAGWFVITGLNGGVGKNLRSLKFHSGNIKDAEAVLNTL